MIRFAALLSLLLGSDGLRTSSAGDVEIIRRDGELLIRIDGSDFATYNFSSKFRKPFFLPVKAADSTVLTRPLDDPEDHDHVHHKGVWLSVDEVNGVRYWMEAGPIVTRELTVFKASGNRAVFDVINEWQRPRSAEAVVTEKTRISIYANRLLTWDIRFIAAYGPVDFLDTKEGLLGYRMASSMKERNTGTVVSSDGTQGAAACWGKRFDWIDYSGTVDGRIYGVALMDHPDNFRPSRYHVRDYGLFSISPFGEHAYSNGRKDAKPVQLKPGNELRLQYAIYFHDGDSESGGVQLAFNQFIELTRGTSAQ